jgi:hypothetical protein
MDLRPIPVACTAHFLEALKNNYKIAWILERCVSSPIVFLNELQNNKTQSVSRTRNNACISSHHLFRESDEYLRNSGP